MGEEEQEKTIVRTIEKALHDRGLVVISRPDGENRVIEAEDPSTRTVTTITVKREKK